MMRKGPEPGARRTAACGLAAMFFGYFLLPWGDGERFIDLRGDVFGDRWPDADFNRQLQEMFGIWGFALLMLIAVAALVALRKTELQSVFTVLAVLLLGGAAWHQGMIGTVNGLNLFSHLPQVGAVAIAIALVFHKAELTSRETFYADLRESSTTTSSDSSI